MEKLSVSGTQVNVSIIGSMSAGTIMITHNMNVSIDDNFKFTLKIQYKFGIRDCVRNSEMFRTYYWFNI